MTKFLWTNRITLACLLSLGFLAQGRAADDMVGAYTLDKEAMKKSALAMLHDQLEKSLAGQSEEAQKAQKAQFAAFEAQLAGTFDSMVMEPSFEKDGTFSVSGSTGGEAFSIKGTWKRDGETVTMTTTHSNGGAVDTPEVISCTFKDGILRIKPEASMPFEMLFVKKKS